MSETSCVNATVAVVGNPTSNKGKGAEVGKQVVELLQEAGRKHGFNVIDVTGESFDDSLANARNRRNEYDYLVAVGGDGMIALGANAVGCSGKPLGIVATGSGAHLRRTSCTSRQRPVSLSTSKIAPSSLAAPMAAS